MYAYECIVAYERMKSYELRIKGKVMLRGVLTNRRIYDLMYTVTTNKNKRTLC
jgi:hypothetical protein